MAIYNVIAGLRHYGFLKKSEFGEKDQLEIVIYPAREPLLSAPTDQLVEEAAGKYLQSGIKFLRAKTIETPRDIGSLTDEIARNYSGKVIWRGPTEGKVALRPTATDRVLVEYFPPCQQA